MKHSTTIISIVVIVLFILGIFIWSNKNKEVVITPPDTNETGSIIGCYTAGNSKDLFTMNIKAQNGENISGNLAFKNFDKDSSSGTLVGTYKNNIILGDYSFNSEGMDSVRQIIFKKVGDDFVMGYGDMGQTGVRFSDLNDITYDDTSPLSVFKKVDCIDITGWKTMTQNNVSFKYPESLSTKYISKTEWPPVAQVIPGDFVCTYAGEENSPKGKTEERNINGHKYCVTTVSEGAAGSTYNKYAYETKIQNKNVSFAFTLRLVQCGNYSNSEKIACEVERNNFDIDSIMDRIIQTTIFS